MAVKSSQTKYPQTFFQATASNPSYASWENLNNLKTNSSNLNSNYAKTKMISENTGNQNKVGKLRLSGFNFNLPEGAEVTSVTVGFSYKLAPTHTGNYPSIANPSIWLRYTGVQDEHYEYYTRDAPRPGSQWGSYTRSFNGIYEQEIYTGGSTTQNINGVVTVVPSTITRKIYYNLPSRENVNHKDFGVQIEFPENLAPYAGYIYLNNVYITVNYKTPTYSVSLYSEAGKFYKNVATRVNAVLNNLDLMSYQPTLHLQVPDGTSVEVKNPNGSFEQSSTNPQMYVWKPRYSKTTGNVELGLDITCTSTGSKEFILTELYRNTSTTFTFNVVEQSTHIYDDASEKTIYAVQNTDFTIPIRIPLSSLGEDFYLYTDTAIKIKNGSSYTNVSAFGYYPVTHDKFDSTGACNLIAKTSATGLIYLGLTLIQEVPESNSFVVKVVPEGYAVPRLSVLKLSSEECHRLGNGYNYEVSSERRINCQAENIESFVDYYRNFRIGVCNSIAETVNLSNIFNACANWSDGVSVLNEFEKDKVTFTYDENYPVYIILTGNYDTTTCNLFEGEYTQPQIIELNREDGFDTVIFPAPIQNMISESVAVADLTLPALSNSNNLIFYNLPFEDTFDSSLNLAIRGLAVKITGDVDFSTLITAKLKSPAGITGERSLVLSSVKNTHMIGGTTDRWGFSISELAEIEDFELELTINNNNSSDLNAAIEKVEFIVYYTFYENQLVDWFVDGENMAGFNCFLKDVKIPAGLKTSTKYLTVEGTDTNNAFRQNIKEKEITIEFDIDECSIEEATATLQDVTEKILTRRDDSFRPIPKQVEFSHFPGIYWEYLMEDTIEANAEGPNYECKVKLTIPSGTAYTKEEISTGKSGRVAGVAKINPVIVVTPLNSHIEINEKYTNQKFVMTYSDWSNEDILEIDCKNRKILLHSNEDVTDISVNADVNTDWFLLSDQFFFDETGCIIQSVTWTERK